MSELEKFELVNKCETDLELSRAILQLTNPETGLIRGRTREFDGKKMASFVFHVINEDGPANFLTREYGIRQQALYIKYYNEVL